jgi:hypothetical protein
MNPAIELSIALPELATLIDDFLQDKVLEPTAFVLMVNTREVTQYVSNASREDGKALIESLLERWSNNRADIPAHYNPDLQSEAGQPKTRTTKG